MESLFESHVQRLVLGRHTLLLTSVILGLELVCIV